MRRASPHAAAGSTSLKVPERQTVSAGRARLFALIASCAATAAHAQSPVSIEFTFTSFSSTYSNAVSSAYLNRTDTAGFGVWQGGNVNGVELDHSLPPPPVNPPIIGLQYPYSTYGSTGVPISVPVGHELAFAPGTTSVEFSTSKGWIWEASGFQYEPWTPPATPNLITFTPATNVLVQPGQIFSLGTFSVTNGDWLSPIIGGFDPTELGFSLTTVSSDPLLDGHEFSGTFMYKTNAVPPNQVFGDAAYVNADTYWIAERADLGAARVFERGLCPGTFSGDPCSYTGTFELFGYIGSLELTGFSNASGGMFLTDSIEDLPYTPAAVPVPGAAWLMLSGMAAFGRFMRRRRV
jgi:hypothetical protein